MQYTFMDNDPISWSIAIAVAVAASALLYAAKKIVVRRLGLMASRTQTYLDDVAVAVLSSTHPLFILSVGLYLGTLWLALPPKSTLMTMHAIVVAFLLQLARWGDTCAKEWLGHYRHHRSVQDAASTSSTAALDFVARSALWLVIALMILENLGVNVTTLVASLGIGGIAVALALQNILGDLFSSLAIVLDKPFVIGDFIIIDEAMGTVEYIGLKTTRLRSLGGEQIVFSNSDLLKSRIRNYKRMQSRRIAFIIGVSYQTTETQLRAIPQIIRDIVSSHAQVALDRAHFKEFGASSLNFEVVYIVASADYNVYMDIQQAINFALFQRFARESIEFAYPAYMVPATNPQIQQPRAANSNRA